MLALFTLNSYRHRLLLAVAVGALCLIPFSPARVAGIFLAAGILPGLGIASRTRFRIEESLGLGSAISPALFGIFVLFALWMGASVLFAAWVATGACLVIFVQAGRGAGTSADGGSRRVLWRPGALFAVAAVISFALPLTNFWWRARSDSWFHAAIMDKLLRDGVPLTDPYFTGLRLQYMYFYHAILAACASLAHIDAFHAMILVNAMALFSCTMAFYALAGLFSRRTGPRVAGTTLWLFGMNGWFYLFYVMRIARALTGATHGTAMLHGFFPWSPSGHDTAMSLISVEGNQFMFLDKFMLGTAFSLTLSLAAGVLFMLLCARRGHWSVRHDAVLFLSIAGAMLLHPVTGVTMAAVTLCVLLLLLAVRSQTARGGPSYLRLAGWIVAGLAVTIPYVRSVMPAQGSGGTMASLAFQPAVALGLFADVLPALAFAVWFFRRAGEDTDTPDRFGARPFSELTLSGTGVLVVWLLWMTAVALTVDLTTNNETKFSFFVWLPLCVLAVGCLEKIWSGAQRRLVLVALASATLPLHMLYFHHAARDHSSLAVTDSERAVYQWIEESTPRDAVFIEADDVVRVPVLADRDLYWGTEAYAHNWGYPDAEMSARRNLRDHVFSAQGPGEDDVMQLRVLGRRVFVIYRRKPGDVINAPERFEHSSRLRGRFATTDVAVWEVVLD